MREQYREVVGGRDGLIIGAGNLQTYKGSSGSSGGVMEQMCLPERPLMRRSNQQGEDNRECEMEMRGKTYSHRKTEKHKQPYEKEVKE